MTQELKELSYNSKYNDLNAQANKILEITTPQKLLQDIQNGYCFDKTYTKLLADSCYEKAQSCLTQKNEYHDLIFKRRCFDKTNLLLDKEYLIDQMDKQEELYKIYMLCAKELGHEEANNQVNQKPEYFKIEEKNSNRNSCNVM